MISFKQLVIDYPLFIQHFEVSLSHSVKAGLHILAIHNLYFIVLISCTRIHNVSYAHAHSNSN